MNIVWRCTHADSFRQTFFDDDADDPTAYATVHDCTCSAFKYNGTCIHIDTMRDLLCTWSSDADHAKPLDEGPPPRCPECQGRVAVARGLTGG